jgi:S-adenosylmethionine:tRNA ribosyltransferase-isomerase
VLVSEFDFTLPQELIAQEPPVQRGDSRMLLLHRGTGDWKDEVFAQFADHLRAGDLLVLNDARVIPARLFGTRMRRANEEVAASGRIEVLLTEQLDDWTWNALVKPGRKLRVGDAIEFAGEGGEVLQAEVTASGEHGERTIRFGPIEDFERKLDRLGHMPLPPYIHRPDRDFDRERYQTIYANRRGSSAAPTAGLHFTPQVLAQIRAAGVMICNITLHVGLGTFQPVRATDTSQITLHSERYELSQECSHQVNAAKAEGRRVVAAGTTTVRTLEHCAAMSPDGRLQVSAGSTNIFIGPGFRFRAVDALLTNFHLPQSTLLMLVAAFAGRDNVLAAYRHAVEARYRFFSYGDCMFIS